MYMYSIIEGDIAVESTSAIDVHVQESTQQDNETHSSVRGHIDIWRNQGINESSMDKS